MKIRVLAAVMAVALAAPAALLAQDGSNARRGTGYMGILFQWDTPRETTVADVVAGSPADRAGVRKGDVVVSLNGRAPTSESIEALRDNLDRGDTVHLRLRHDGQEVDRTIVAGARPSRIVVYPGQTQRGVVIPGGDHEVIIRVDTVAERFDSLFTHMDSMRVRVERLRRGQLDTLMRRAQADGTRLRDSLFALLPRNGEFRWRTETGGPGARIITEFGGRSLAGAEFAEMNAGLARYFHTRDGLLVTEVATGTPAARAGLQPGDVVQEADGRAVQSMRELREAFSRANENTLRLTVLRDGRKQQLTMRWQTPDVRVYRTEREPRARTRQP